VNGVPITPGSDLLKSTDCNLEEKGGAAQYS